MKILAGLEVTTKAVERTAEAMGKTSSSETRRDRPRSPTGFAGDDGPTDSRCYTWKWTVRVCPW